jgi:hypothetical protein
MTRHTNSLDIIIDRSAVPRSTESSISLNHEGMEDPTDDVDERNDNQIIKTVGQGMEKISRPRNASDILGLPSLGRTVPRRPAMSESQMTPVMQLLPKRRGFRRDQMPDAAPSTSLGDFLKIVRDRQDATAEPQQQIDTATRNDTAVTVRLNFDAWINGNDDDTDTGTPTVPQQAEKRELLGLFTADPETPPATPRKPSEPSWQPPVPTLAPEDNSDGYTAPGM